MTLAAAKALEQWHGSRGFAAIVVSRMKPAGTLNSGHRLPTLTSESLTTDL
jgi:hypothetical protein